MAWIAECCLLIYGGNDFLIWRKMNEELTGLALHSPRRTCGKMESYSARR